MARDGEPAAGRDIDLRLAPLHLRSGSTWLARAELEAAAGRDRLDPTALADLAEARWRTGDLDGAIEAAEALPENGRSAPIALALTAEAAARAGRPADEVERLVEAAVAAAEDAEGGGIEALIGGLATAAPWPIAGLGGAADGGASTIREPAEELRAAQDALRSGDEDDGAVRLLLLLRRAPELAAVIIDALADREGPLVDVVRGDALRAVGREAEADEAYATAAGHLADASGPPAGAVPRARVR